MTSKKVDKNDACRLHLIKVKSLKMATPKSTPC